MNVGNLKSMPMVISGPAGLTWGVKTEKPAQLDARNDPKGQEKRAERNGGVKNKSTRPQKLSAGSSKVIQVKLNQNLSSWVN